MLNGRTAGRHRAILVAIDRAVLMAASAWNSMAIDTVGEDARPRTN